ncbi:RNA helicase [Maublancomyces gigas]|uniref:ATP-dependent RNA helicase n=1 Tax=Discina gigas TaxID=1032678 RepID=A0ABR3G8V5_9PEZI
MLSRAFYTLSKTLRPTVPTNEDRAPIAKADRPRAQTLGRRNVEAPSDTPPMATMRRPSESPRRNDIPVYDTPAVANRVPRKPVPRKPEPPAMLLRPLPALPVLMHPLPPLPISALLCGPTSVDVGINTDTPSTSIDKNTARIPEQQNPFARFSVMAYPSFEHTTIRSREPTTGNSGVNTDAPPSATIDSPGARILESRTPKAPPAGPEVSALRHSGKYPTSVFPVPARPDEPTSKDAKISADTPATSVGKPKSRIPEQQDPLAKVSVMAYTSIEPAATSIRSREPTVEGWRAHADAPPSVTISARIPGQNNPFRRHSSLEPATSIRPREPTVVDSKLHVDAPLSATIGSPGAWILERQTREALLARPEAPTPRRSGKYPMSVLPVLPRPGEPTNRDAKISTDTPSASADKPKSRTTEQHSPFRRYSSVEPATTSLRSREPTVEDSKIHMDAPPSATIDSPGARILERRAPEALPERPEVSAPRHSGKYPMSVLPVSPRPDESTNRDAKINGDSLFSNSVDKPKARTPEQHSPFRRYSSVEPATSIRPREPTVEDSKTYTDVPLSVTTGARILERRTPEAPPARPEVPAPRRSGKYPMSVLPVLPRPDEPTNKDTKINGDSLFSNSVDTPKARTPEQKSPRKPPTIPAVTVPPHPGGVQLPVYPTSLPLIGPTNGNANSNTGVPPYASVDEPKARAPRQKPGTPPTIPVVAIPPRSGGVQLPTSLCPTGTTNGNANSDPGAPPYANVDKPEAQTLQQNTPPARSPVVSIPLFELAMSSSSKKPNEEAKINTDAPSSASVGGPRTRILEKQTLETPAARPAVIAPLRSKEPTTEDAKTHTDIPPPVETATPQILKLQPPGTLPERPSVVEFAMSLRPVGVAGISESASRSALPSGRGDRAKASYRELQTPPTVPAATANSTPGPKMPLINETNTLSDPPDALPRLLNPQKKANPRSRNPKLLGPKSRDRNVSTPRPIPVPPTTATPHDALGGGSRLLKCPKCPPSCKQFKNEKSLTQHLASGYHERKSETLDLPNSTSKTSSRSSRGHGKQSDNGPSTLPQQPTASNTGRRPSARSALVPVSAEAIAASIQKITAALAGTTRVTVSDHLLHGIDAALSETQMLVISPTREIAIHIADLLSTRGITCYACIGGTLVYEDKKRLAAGPHVVSGTLGRVADMLQHRFLQPRNIAVLVLNRDDELRRKSYHEQLASVYQFLEPDTKIVRAKVGGGSSMSLLI